MNRGKIGAVQFSIPPRSLDLNPIENAFNLVEKKFGSDAVKFSISKESYAKFVERVENTLLSYPREPIDNIIKSMPKRISHVIQCKVEMPKTSLVTFLKSSNTTTAGMSTENLATRANCIELKISQKLLALFLQYTFVFMN